jgi:chromosome segregation ATPase
MQKDRDQYADQIERMCEKSKLADAKCETMELKTALDSMTVDLQSSQAQVVSLRGQLRNKTTELQSLHAQVNEMVPRKELIAIRGELHSAMMKNTTSANEVSLLREKCAIHAKTVEELRAALHGAQAQVADMVPRTEHLASQVNAKTAIEDLKLKTNELQAVQESLLKARSGLYSPL